MSTKESRNELVEAPEDEALRSACVPPRRYSLASQLDRTQAYSKLFDEPADPVCIGRFRLIALIGGGGMGEIYSAYDDQLDRNVAVKLVRADRPVSPDAQERLLREAQTLARLSHPQVVQVYEAGRFEGRVFIAMELIQGQTLRAWLQEHAKPGDRKRQREVVRQFVAAGRGLEAAHAVRLVHRDFKPDNVLIGYDGRPRVVDFGLARSMEPGHAALASEDRERSRPRASMTLPTAAHVWFGSARLMLDSTLPRDEPTVPGPHTSPVAARVVTTRGRILGTPPYMSPEQMRGAPADHRSDQFSFCVALYEALHGQMPFSGSTISARRRAIEQGRINEPPRGVSVPAPVRRAIRRGLSADPAARFSSMGELLDALEAWSRQRRGRMVAAALTLMLSGGVTSHLLTNPPAEQCTEVSATMATLWTPARRAVIHKAFSKTGLPYADASWSTIEQHLDRYTTRLENEIEATCEATHEHGTQSSELMELRMLCLGSRRRHLDALLEQLAHADAAAVERAPLVISSLPDLSTCNHPGTLRYGMPAPAPAIEPAVLALRNQLAVARARELLGHGKEALRIAREQLAQAESLGYGPLLAEALYQTGRVLVYHGRDEAAASEGEALLLRARDIAESERHDELAAEIWNHLVLGAARNHEGTERGHRWYEHALAAIKRIGSPALLHADALRNLGRLYFQEDRLVEAREHQRQALALIEPEPEISRLVHAVYQHDLATTARRMGEYEQARHGYETALALYVAALGEEHPHVADLRYDIAMLHIDRGDPASGRALLEDILRIHAGPLGETHVVLARIHGALAELDRQQGALARAREHAVRSLENAQRLYGDGHIEVANAQLRLGAIAFQGGAYGEALIAYEMVMALVSRHLGETHFEVGSAHANIAEARLALGQHEEALAAIGQAERILAPHMDGYAAIGPFLASVRGRALLGLGRIEDAVRMLEQAHHGADALEAMARAHTSWALARALSSSSRGRDPRAHALARQALAIFEQQSADVHTPGAEVRGWLEAARGDH
jgi:serine/threonine protein kinase/tetratricopeptide (TPR) repeat protein